MFRTLTLLCFLVSFMAVPQADAAASLPDYREAGLEKRWQVEPAPVQTPSAEQEAQAAERAGAAVRNPDFDAMAAAARDIVAHAPEGGVSGWRRAAAAWLSLSRSSRDYANDANHDWEARERADRTADDALREAAYSMYAAYRVAPDPDSAGQSLRALAAIQETRAEFISAELALQASLAVREDAGARTRLDRIRNENGFRILEARSDEDRDDPRACLALSAAVDAPQRDGIADYVTLLPDHGDNPVVLRESTICIGNLNHGASYTLAIRDGLKDVHGRAVVPGERGVLVADRPARAEFSGGRYVLPRIGSVGIPLTSVNMAEVPLTLLRITEGNLVDEVLHRRVGRNLNGYDLRRIVSSLGEQIWQGTVSVQEIRNREVVTAVPMDRLLPVRKPGVYLLVADIGDSESRSWEDRAIQWLVVSDIGLVTFHGADGLSVFARSLATAEPMAGVTLALQARNEDVLAEATTDTDGRATFAPGLLRGTGGREAVLLRARAAADDYTFLSLAGAGFDLADRGVGGREAPGPVDAFVYTERGIYRPGETVHLTALVRDDRGGAVDGLPLELTVTRPDGVTIRTLAVQSGPTGAIPYDHALPDSAITGAWRFALGMPDGGATIGETSVQVADFVPPRIEVTAESPEAFVTGEDIPLTIAARFLYGAPGADLAVNGQILVEADPEPFAAWTGYRFGQADGQPVPSRADLPGVRTGSDGQATLSVVAPEVAENTHPLRVRIDAAVLERGGRPVGKTVLRPLRDGRERLGIKPQFRDAVGSGAPAVFDVVLVDGAGAAVGGRPVAWRLYREERELFWYRQSGGNWQYREIVSDTTVDSGALQTTNANGGPARISLQADWGNYRLEVAEPDRPGVMPASTRFQVGWSRDDGGPGTPDLMTVRLDRDRYLSGETAMVRLEAPFDGIALVTVLTDRVAQVHTVPVTDGRGALSLPVMDWTAGAYVTATVFRPSPAEAEQGPGRAVGLAWLTVDQPARRLSVAFEMPENAVSGGPVPVAFRVSDGAGLPVQADLTVAAVDEGILQLTGFASPDPASVIFGKRRMAVELRDLYGRLIDARQGRPGAVRSGGDAGGGLLGGIQPPRRTVALFHGLMRTGADGRGEGLLDIPEGFSGRLRLMAVAHSRAAVGHGEGRLVIRDPLIADLYLPRFLAPGDTAGITVELVNADAPAGDYAAVLSVTGPVRIAGSLPDTVHLASGGRWSAPLTLSADAPGDAVLTLAVTGPEGVVLERRWTLALRPAQAWRQTRHAVALKPGGSITLTGALAADLYPADARVSVSLSPVPYDLHGLLASLDRYPYGCTEQTISRALPLLYVSALDAGANRTAPDPDLLHRIQDAVQQVLSRQRADGSFGLWSARDNADPWISAYALDFLERARIEGYAVDAAALQRSRLYFDSMLNRQSLSDGEMEAAAYGLAVLARGNAVEPGIVRHFIEARLDRVDSGMGRVQVALAAAAFGFSDGADTALAAAIPAMGGGRHASYGSDLRDAAALVTVAAALNSDVLRQATDRLRKLTIADSHTSTQEKAWMVVAAWELSRAMASVPLTIDGEDLPAGQGAFHQSLDIQALDKGLTIGNPGDRPVELTIGVGGVPVTEEPASANGITITRRFLTQDGMPADLAAIAQGDLLTVVLEGRISDSQFPRRLLVADLLPAGLEIQTAITDGTAFALPESVDQPETLRLRDDRYVAALNRAAGETFRLAYLVRAVTPGSFRVPAAYAEDMYDPAIQARGGMQRLNIRQ